jgi:5'-methylthioadenosine phosphorylase/purine-nucleoside phosphorylase
VPIHLRADTGDYAQAVLCPGDPMRAQYIADRFFDPGFRQVNAERGMLGFTGTFEGKPISVQATGMGCPSAGIVFEELAMLGVQRLIRVGTCGGLQPGMQMADTVVAAAASADDTTPLRYAQMEGFAPSATYSLVERAATLSTESSDHAVHVGGVVTSGIFYDPDPTAFDRWRRLGHLAVEMEAAMMYTIAAVKGMEALAIMTVSDLLAEGESPVRISEDELKLGVDRMMEIGCRVATG